MNSDRKTFLAELYINTYNIYDCVPLDPSNSDQNLERILVEFMEHEYRNMSISIFSAWLLNF